MGMTTTLGALVGLAAALTLRRYGHSLISPQAVAREILDTLEDGVVLVGEDGILRDANRAFLKLVDTRELMAIGRPITDWIPEFRDAHRGYLTVAIGCTGGQHRSVYMVDKLVASLARCGEDVTTRHNVLKTP